MVKLKKIKRNTLFKTYKEGGLQMINVFHFENSLKLGWLKRIITTDDNSPAPWFKLVSTLVVNQNKLCSMGADWCKMKIKKLQIPSGNMC